MNTRRLTQSYYRESIEKIKERRAVIIADSREDRYLESIQITMEAFLRNK